MGRANSKWALLAIFAGMTVVVMGGLMTTMNYAKVAIKKRQGEVRPNEPDGPSGPFATRIKELSRNEQLVTQFGKDDRPSFGRYVETKAPGLYLDIVSGEVLFTSLDKLDSVLGFAEFSKPFDAALVTEQKPSGSTGPEFRVESKTARSHLGWIATDDTGSRRYVINSSALRFVPAAELEKYGLGQHRGLFAQALPQGGETMTR